MSDTPLERDTDSKTNLIEVQHVGVTAQLQSPLKNFLQPASSSSLNETDQLTYKRRDKRKSRYQKFSNDTQMDTTTTSVTETAASARSTDCTTTESSKLLYEMHATHKRRAHRGKSSLAKQTPTKIEFQLYQRPHGTAKRYKRKLANAFGGKRKKEKEKQANAQQQNAHATAKQQTTLMQRLRQSLHNMQQANATNLQQEYDRNARIFEDLPEPTADASASGIKKNTSARAQPQQKEQMSSGRQRNFQDIHIGIYPFEHGCAEYLRTTDAHPQILSIALAERATLYATRFWAEFFGTLHIGVTFVVTFLLQTYRFLLFTLVNTLLVGILHMTSDYLIKPVLTVLFNGYLQPPMIFLYNILASLRDLLLPIAEIINNFMKPIATVGRSIRLIHVNQNYSRKYMKEV